MTGESSPICIQLTRGTGAQTEVVEGKPLRIAMISFHSSPLGEVGTRDTGGMSVYIREVAKGLAASGHSVDIFTRRQQEEQPPTMALAEGVRIVHVDAGGLEPLSPGALSRHVSEFSTGVERLRSREALCYDVVHSHYWLSGLAGREVSRWWKLPHLIVFHTLGRLKNQAFRASIEPGVRIDAEMRLCGECDRVIATTGAERMALMDLYGTPAERIAVVPCGVDLTRFSPLNGHEARRLLGIRADETVLLYVGRFDPVKGIGDLLSAMAVLKAVRPVRLILVGGDGESEAEARAARELSDALCLGECVTFLGRVPHESLPTYYSAADLLVMPSHYESFGLVALEALACGTPVVSTPVGAMKTLLVDGRNGTLVELRDPASLAEGICRALQSKEAGGYSVARVRCTVEPFGWAAIATLVESEYRSLTSGEKRDSKRARSPEPGAAPCRRGRTWGAPVNWGHPWSLPRPQAIGFRDRVRCPYSEGKS